MDVEHPTCMATLEVQQASTRPNHKGMSISIIQTKRDMHPRYQALPDIPDTDTKIIACTNYPVPIEMQRSDQVGVT
jgi:hypothetical protein